MRRLLALALLTLAAAAVPSTAAASPGAAAAPRYVAIGDSITGTGYAVERGWVNEFGRAIGAAEVTNLARNGWYSFEILRAVQYDQRWRAAIAGADVITINAGMNEFFTVRDLYSKGACRGADNRECMRRTTLSFAITWDALLAEVRALAPRARVIAVNLYHPLEAFDQHFGWTDAVGDYLDAVNTHIAASIGVEVADVRRAYNGAAGRDDPIARGYILPDAIHSTDAGHAVIAAVLTALEGAQARRSPSPGLD